MSAKLQNAFHRSCDLYPHVLKKKTGTKRSVYLNGSNLSNMIKCTQNRSGNMEKKQSLFCVLWESADPWMLPLFIRTHLEQICSVIIKYRSPGFYGLTWDFFCKSSISLQTGSARWVCQAFLQRSALTLFPITMSTALKDTGLRLSCFTENERKWDLKSVTSISHFEQILKGCTFYSLHLVALDFKE